MKRGTMTCDAISYPFLSINICHLDYHLRFTFDDLKSAEEYSSFEEEKLIASIANIESPQMRWLRALNRLDVWRNDQSSIVA